MAISPTTGATINNASAGTSLAFAANTTTSAQDVVIAVAILNTAVSVSSITDLGGNTYTLQSATNNGSAVRVELWACHNITGHTSNVITITLSGSSLASAAYEEYAGVTPGIGNIATPSTATATNAQNGVATQDSNNWAVTAIAIASSSGDTLTANLGTIRRSLIPALTTAGVALIDNSSLNLAELNDAVLISSSRTWAATSLELRTGGAAINVTETVEQNPQASGEAPFEPTAPVNNAVVPSHFNPVPVAANLAGGVVGTAYSETISAQGGTSPYTFAVVSGSLPAGTSLNSSTGVVSGTPTTAATSSFTIQVTDANSYTGTQAFSITVATPASGGAGGSYVFLS